MILLKRNKWGCVNSLMVILTGRERLTAQVLIELRKRKGKEREIKKEVKEEEK